MDVDAVHPNPQPSLHHRKIELQSPQDLTYLQDNLAKSALSKLDLHFPPIPPQPQPATVISLGGPTAQPSNQPSTETKQGEQASTTNENEDENDPFRARVRVLIAEFLTQTWQNAQHNLTLNGLDASTQPIPHTATLSKPPSKQPDDTASSTTHQTGNGQEQERPEDQEKEGVHFTYAPFDPRLQHKLAALHGELEKLTAEVSRLRREAPQKSAHEFESALDEHIRDDDDVYTQAQEREQKRALELLEKGKGMGLDVNKLRQRDGWNEDVREMFDVGVRELGGLSGTWTVDGGGGGSGSGGGSSSTGSNGASAGKGKVMSVTETMGKAVRARDVVMELE